MRSTLITAAGGRTLGLFSSMRAAKHATEALRTRWTSRSCARATTRPAPGGAVRAGRTETWLFGTLTLWQGVDVPGPSLSLVVVDRIPFPAPTIR